MAPPSHRRKRGCVRGQASVIGLILVFGMVLAGSVAVVAFGAGAIEDSQARLSEQRAENAMTQFDSEVALTALGSADVQQVSFGSDRSESYEVQNGTGWMRVTVENQTSGTTDTLLNETLGAVTYEGVDTTIAYQGGGVWKKGDGNRSVMVSPPEFHFRGGTLTLPVVNVSGDSSLGEKANIRHRETVRKHPNATTANENPLENHLVKVTVKSDYYRAWGHYFEERTDGVVEYDHDRQVVNLTLVSPLSLRKMTAATASLSASGDFEILGGTHGHCNSDDYTDSYNSSGTSDDYCDQWPLATGNDGDVTYGNNIDISSGSGSDEIRGDIVAGGNVTVGTGAGKPYVFGHINYTDNCNPSVLDCTSRITKPTASVNEIDGVKTARSITWHIESTVEEIKSSNDNTAPKIESNELNFTASVKTRTLDSGRYYLEEIDMAPDEKLELDTTSGNVTIVVNEDVTLDGSGSGGANITVLGDGTAKMYVNGSGVGAGDHFVMRKNTDVRNDGDDAAQFRLYGKNDFNMTLDAGGSNLAKFVGVVYAPPGDSGTGSVDITGGEIYGALLTGMTTLDDGSIHFDKALEEKPIISRDAKVLRITYLHVTVSRVRVS